MNADANYHLYTSKAFTMSRFFIVPSAPILFGNQYVKLDRKMFDGIKMFQQHLNAEVWVLGFSGRHSDIGNFDNIETSTRSDCIFFESIDSINNPDFFKSNDVVMLSADDYRHFDIHKRITGCGDNKPTILYCIENTPLTRFQILLSEKRSVKKFLGGTVHLLSSELKRRVAMKKAAAIQCNGLASYYTYRKTNNNAIHYFDTRLSALHTPLLVSARPDVNESMPSPKLSITYSGRLTAIKGSNHLIPLALELLRLNLDFELNIIGKGDLYESIATSINHNNLEAFVKLRGSFDFETELIPFVRDKTDLFFCPHVQGDPSCTYFETLALGIPIIGFDNEAWASIYDQSHGRAGWLIKSKNISDAAIIIDELSKNRTVLNAKKKECLAYAGGTTFESQFAVRAKQIQSLMGK